MLHALVQLLLLSKQNRHWEKAKSIQSYAVKLIAKTFTVFMQLAGLCKICCEGASETA